MFMSRVKEKMKEENEGQVNDYIANDTIKEMSKSPVYFV